MSPDKQAAKERARLQAKTDDCRDRPDKTAQAYIELEDHCEWWRQHTNAVQAKLDKLYKTLKELSKGNP